MEFLTTHATAILAGCIFANGMLCGAAIHDGNRIAAGYFAFAAMICIAAI